MPSLPPRPTSISFTSAVPTRDYLLGILHDARVTTLQRVAKVGPEELDWRFADGWNTIGALLAHIVAVEHYFRVHCVEQRAWTHEEESRWTPGMDLGEHVPQLRGKPLATYMAELEEARAATLAALARVDHAALIEHRTGIYGDGYNLAWVIYHQAEDEVHHRGQISILRKLWALGRRADQIPLQEWDDPRLRLGAEIVAYTRTDRALPSSGTIRRRGIRAWGRHLGPGLRGLHRSARNRDRGRYAHDLRSSRVRPPRARRMGRRAGDLALALPAERHRLPADEAARARP